MSSWTYEGFKQDILSGKNWIFPLQQSRAEGSGKYSYAHPMHAHHPLHSASLYRSSSRAKVVDAAGREGEPCDKVCEIADAAASFEEEKVTDRQKTICRDTSRL